MNSDTAFGQNTSDTEWERIKDKYPYNLDAPKPPSPHIDLDPALRELKESRPPSSGMNSEVLAEAIEDAKKVRKQALSNAKQALEEAFAPKFHQMFAEKLKEEEMSKNIVPQKSTELPPLEVSESDIDELVEELEGEIGGDFPQEGYNNSPEKKKNLEETKTLIQNFREKVAKYPKHLSYEGSMVLCVMLSMKDTVHPTLNNLPMVDQTLIRALVPSKFLGDLDYFSVTFDNNKDFNMKFSCRAETDPYLLTMFNSVAHPRPEDLKDMGAGVVPVEKDGDRIAVGGKILLNKKGIKRLIGVEPLKREAKRDEEEPRPSRQPVAGRNAYEIRADVLQMAVDWSSREGVSKDYSSPEDVVDLAKTFYQFVENRR